MVVFAASRWPGLMPDNFSAVYALVFCGGVFLPGGNWRPSQRLLEWTQRWAPLRLLRTPFFWFLRNPSLLLALGTMLITDLLLNLYYRRLYLENADIHAAPVEFFSPYLLANYASYLTLFWFGTKFKPSSKWWKIAGGGVLGALVFYLISNTASWMQLPGYAKTFAGWIQALTVGLPGFPPTWMFLLKTLASGGLFAGLFAGAMKLAASESEVPETKPVEEPVEPEGAQPEESKA